MVWQSVIKTHKRNIWLEINAFYSNWNWRFRSKSNRKTTKYFLLIFHLIKFFFFLLLLLILCKLLTNTTSNKILKKQSIIVHCNRKSEMLLSIAKIFQIFNAIYVSSLLFLMNSETKHPFPLKNIWASSERHLHSKIMLSCMKLLHLNS